MSISARSNTQQNVYICPLQHTTKCLYLPAPTRTLLLQQIKIKTRRFGSQLSSHHKAIQYEMYAVFWSDWPPVAGNDPVAQLGHVLSYLPAVRSKADCTVCASESLSEKIVQQTHQTMTNFVIRSVIITQVNIFGFQQSTFRCRALINATDTGRFLCYVKARRVKSHPPFAGIIRSSPYSPH